MPKCIHCHSSGLGEFCFDDCEACDGTGEQEMSDKTIWDSPKAPDFRPVNAIIAELINTKKEADKYYQLWQAERRQLQGKLDASRLVVTELRAENAQLLNLIKEHNTYVQCGGGSDNPDDLIIFLPGASSNAHD